jgi:hypothetical protein
MLIGEGAGIEPLSKNRCMRVIIHNYYTLNAEGLFILKIKSIYKPTSNTVNRLIGLGFKEAKHGNNTSYFWQQAFKLGNCFAPPFLTAFSTLKLSSYLVGEETAENIYFQVLLATAIYLELISFNYIRQRLQLNPTISFEQYNYITDEIIISALEDIKNEMSEDFNNWLKSVCLENYEDTLPFILKEIKQGYCYGAVMSLMEQCSDGNITKIKDYVVAMKLNIAAAVKKQILYFMARTAEAGEINPKSGPAIILFTKDKQKITKKLIDNLYEKNKDLVVQASSISLNQGSSVFLGQLINCITESSYLPIKETSYQFLQGEKTLKEMLPLYKFFPNIKNKEKAASTKSEKKELHICFPPNEFGRYLLKGQEEESKAKKDRKEYIREHTRTISETDFLFIKLRISHEQEGSHATALFIQEGHYFFFDPNDGLFECNNIQSLADKICLVMSTSYSDFDLNKAELLVHMPIAHPTERINFSERLHNHSL